MRPVATLVCVLACVLGTRGAPFAQDAARAPNVLWITIDDCGPDFGCYGNELVRTPNLDRLAARGQRFENCFVTTPVCSPVRSALITGCYATTIGSHQHRSSRALPEGYRPVTEVFREAGYRVTSLPSQRVGVERFLGDEADEGRFLTLTGRLKLDFNFNRGATEGMFEDWDRERGDEPFFALIDFNPQKGPAGFVEDYARRTATQVEPAEVTLAPYWPDTPAMRQRVARYHEAIGVLDAEVGRVLAWLEREELAQDTLVFVWGDHGMAYFRHKQWCYDSGLRVPLIVAGPGVGARVRTELVSSIDLAASSLVACGIELPAYMEGRDFLGADAEPRTHVFASRDRCDETEDRVRAVRDVRFKLIRNFRPELAYAGRNDYTRRAFTEVAELLRRRESGELTDAQARWLGSGKPEWELYDLARDPQELENRAEDPALAGELARLRSLLDEWVALTDAHNPLPEPLENVAPDAVRERLRASR